MSNYKTMFFNRTMLFPLWKSHLSLHVTSPHRNSFHTTAGRAASNQLVKTFMKMGDKFGENKKKKKPFFAVNIGQPESSVQSVVQEKRRRFVRRENALNKVFMSHITDFMSDGQVSHLFQGRGIEISRVRVSPDFQILFVSWLTRQGEDEEEIQRLLDSYAFPIRDQLSQLRIVGNVPRIVFVKDKQKAALGHLNELMNRADYGEDFQPVYPSLMKTDCMRLSDIKAVETMAQDDLQKLPDMRNDVFGIDYDDIMSAITKAVQKSQATHRQGVGNPIFLGSQDLPRPDPSNPDMNPLRSETNPSKIDVHSEPTMTYVEYMRAQKIAKAKAKEKWNEMMESEREGSEKVGEMGESEWEEDGYLDEREDGDKLS